ncbi:HAD-IA family hydrolase [Kitasatospora sp. MMS16-BH015]|uniref:HAD-IA family hydrolase n=1 Tax=Kitasatospora sp. MMS16-BH015 TaxID=2018025 RepID=UPI0027392824|nr:HAD-IA family hydrolase [Kitasatospora sp. MMS16-BH015]
MGIPAVLFDVDGVLLDSTAGYRRVWDAWSALRGLDRELVWSLTFGRRPEDTVRDVAPGLDPVRERAVLDGLLSELGADCPPIAGAGELLRALPADGWALATSGSREVVHRRFAAAGLPLPAVQVYAADVTAGKPAPDCYLLAARRLGRAPADCVVVEDAPAGVAAGRAAGCTVYGLTTTHSTAELLGADRCLPDLASVARELGLALAAQ